MDAWFSSGLIEWYNKNKRDLPWRATKDPYKIWLSEVILQQTQVAQGLSYYLKITERYPSLSHLAAATEDDVLKMWQGLGYYSRARNMLSAARTVQIDLAGKFPLHYHEIRSLKGIGDYTAAAIASFAFGEPQAVVDGNVYRVLSRVFGIETPIDSGHGKKEFRQLAHLLLNKKKPAIHNQAIMEFGALYCKPANPACDNCIFQEKCSAFRSSKVSLLPVKLKSTKVRNRYFTYLVLADKTNKILIRRRGEKDIWQGLYEFPLIESDKNINSQQLMRRPEFKVLCPNRFHLLYSSAIYKHVLSHQQLFSRFFVIRLNSVHGKSLKKSSVAGLKRYAFPRLLEKFMNDCDLKEIV